MDDELTLDLGQPADLAVFMALVPDWAGLAEGLDLTRGRDAQTFRDRLQEAADEAVRGRAAEADVLRRLS